MSRSSTAQAQPTLPPLSQATSLSNERAPATAFAQHWLRFLKFEGVLKSSIAALSSSRPLHWTNLKWEDLMELATTPTDAEIFRNGRIRLDLEGVDSTLPEADKVTAQMLRLERYYGIDSNFFYRVFSISRNVCAAGELWMHFHHPNFQWQSHFQCSDPIATSGRGSNTVFELTKTLAIQLYNFCHRNKDGEWYHGSARAQMANEFSATALAASLIPRLFQIPAEGATASRRISAWTLLTNKEQFTSLYVTPLSQHHTSSSILYLLDILSKSIRLADKKFAPSTLAGFNSSHRESIESTWEILQVNTLSTQFDRGLELAFPFPSSIRSELQETFMDRERVRSTAEFADETVKELQHFCRAVEICQLANNPLFNWRALGVQIPSPLTHSEFATFAQRHINFCHRIEQGKWTVLSRDHEFNRREEESLSRHLLNECFWPSSAGRFKLEGQNLDAYRLLTDGRYRKQLLGESEGKVLWIEYPDPKTWIRVLEFVERATGEAAKYIDEHFARIDPDSSDEESHAGSGSEGYDSDGSL